MELMNTWMLWQDSTDTRLPNCVYFHHGVDGRWVCLQFRTNADYKNSIRGAVGLPVCVIRRSVESMREIWSQFIADGWVRVDPATPRGCDFATTAQHALAHRTRIITNHIGGVGGLYTQLTADSDLCSDLYMKSKPNRQNDFHAVRGMPIYGRLNRQRTTRSMLTNPNPQNTVSYPANNLMAEIQKIFDNALNEKNASSKYTNTNYALEA